jgi:enoyl-CoA hydratase/carnithine racemase
MDILTTKHDGVLSIEFNRPDKKNAITAAMYLTLAAVIKDAEADPSVRVILFHGKPEAFTAGNDLADFMQSPPTSKDSAPFQFLDQLTQAQKPLVAAVTGAAVGIGTTMLLHCDLVYVGDNARFSMPFTNLGLVPESAASYLLPLTAGYQRAAELLLLGEAFGADKANDAGFVTQVLPAADVLPAAQKAAAKLAALPVKSVRLTKALLKHAHSKYIAEQMEVENGHFRAMLTESAAKEAFAAFGERRKPDFSRGT